MPTRTRYAIKPRQEPMGRTIPSWRIVLEEELKRWEKFKDALRIEERIVFEDLMDECRRQLQVQFLLEPPDKPRSRKIRHRLRQG